NWDHFQAPQDTVLSVPFSARVLANDSDADVANTLTPVRDDGPYHGTLTLNSNGTFTYSPTGGYAGWDFFHYRAYDGFSYSNLAYVQIKVNAPPVGAADSYFLTH